MAHNHLKTSIPSTLLLLFLLHSVTARTTYNVATFGAKADGKMDISKALLMAWAKACSSAKPATIYVPQGRFYVKSVLFQGPCKNKAIVIRIAGTLAAPSDYRVIGNTEDWINFKNVNGVTVSGGILDGQGTGLWACKKAGNSCLNGATSLHFGNSENITISALTSLNSQMFHIVINRCKNVKIQGVKVSAPGNSPNTDGIHVQQSTLVTIIKTKIATGDDCISIGPGTTNLWMESIVCGPGHGISIGSLGKDLHEQGVQNVTLKTATFVGTTNGVRIKSWGRPSNGFAKNILFQNIVMNNVQNPILIDQNYCPDNIGCPGQASGVEVSNVMYQNIHGTSATEVAMKFDCSSKYPCSGIKLQNVKITYKNEVSVASCSHASGSASGLVQPTGCL